MNLGALPITGHRDRSAFSRIYAVRACEVLSGVGDSGAAPQRIANPARPRPLASVDHGAAVLATLGMYARIPRMGFQR